MQFYNNLPFPQNAMIYNQQRMQFTNVNRCLQANANGNLIIEKPNPNLKFCRKLWFALKKTQENPALIPIIGLAWAFHGRSFIANSEILGNYLNLKSNSINTNFRQHYFGSIALTDKEFERDYPAILPNKKSWRKRPNSRCEFTIHTTEEQADKIPIKKKIHQSRSNRSRSNQKRKEKKKLLRAIKCYPNCLKRAIVSSPSLLNEVKRLMAAVSRNSRRWQFYFLKRVASDFASIFGRRRKIPAREFVNALIHAGVLNKSLLNIPPAKIEVIHRNLEWLLFTCFSIQDSPPKGQNEVRSEVNLSDAISLCLRFGLLPDIAAAIAEISLDKWPSSSDASSGFLPWFLPTRDSIFAFNLTRDNTFGWSIKLSGSAPDGFSFLRCEGENEESPGGLITTKIRFNAMARRLPPQPDSNQISNQNIDDTSNHNLQQRELNRNLSNDTLEYGRRFFVEGSEILADSWSELLSLLGVEIPLEFAPKSYFQIAESEVCANHSIILFKILHRMEKTVKLAGSLLHRDSISTFLNANSLMRQRFLKWQPSLNLIFSTILMNFQAI
ncbi:hypothetical protein TRFO_24436 [Tritrichomonas foetus]|uniref:Initiator binding domain-containing protein n=1 Tax=Tritrichomonas foetus TaxID=1144522 RepID=A0A1J4KD40_9EUKA|nr:hypothetical protein TRFO_24436 [Tritrichomonas foetus]|eukprot:OHT07357.1 hypothetical protein TRFO_24436 [Tritrichomonas foetus]